MEHPLGTLDVFADPDIHGGQPVVESGVPIYPVRGVKIPGFSYGDETPRAVRRS